MSSVSVCMPYWSGTAATPVALLDTVESLVRFHPDAELSICDDGSLVPLQPFESIRCVVTRLPLKGGALNPCVPINRAVAASRGDVIVLTNPGIRLYEGLIDLMLRGLEEDTYVAASCVEGDRFLVHSSLRPGEGRYPVPPGAGFHHFAMLSRALWDRSGGFDEAYRDGQAFDDNDFLWRLEAAGARFVIRDDLVVKHTRSTTAWPAGGWQRNRDLFVQKWGAKWDHREPFELSA